MKEDKPEKIIFSLSDLDDLEDKTVRLMRENSIAKTTIESVVNKTRS